VRRKYVQTLLVDDSELVRAGLKELLAVVPSLRVAGEAADVPGAIRAIGRLKPDVVILDVSMPGGSGLDVLAAAKQRKQAPIVVMFTNHNGSLLRQKCLAAGADHFFHKTAECDELIELLRKLAGSFHRSASRNGGRTTKK
jgi:DNA-binding NarL/FixJ family response regulator